MERLNLKFVTFTLLCIALRLPDTFRGVSRASNVRYFFLWKASLKSVMFTLLFITLRLPDTFRCVTRASNVGYFFLWKASLKSVMFTLLCIALRLPDTFRCVSRAVEKGKTSTHVWHFDFRKTRANQISEKQITLSFSFRKLIRTHALKNRFKKTDSASIVQHSVYITLKIVLCCSVS